MTLTLTFAPVIQNMLAWATLHFAILHHCISSVLSCNQNTYCVQGPNSDYTHRLEAFLESNLLTHLTAPEKRALRVAGILLPSLLFADDIVFLATQQMIAQRILDTLSEFCA